MKRIPLVIFALLGTVSAAAAEFDPEALARAITPFRDEQTIAIVHINLWKIDADQLVAKVVQLTKLPPGQVARDTAVVRQNLTAFKEAGGKDLFVVLSLADWPHAGVFVVPLYPESKLDALKRLGHLFDAQGQPIKLHEALVFGDARNLARVGKLQPKPMPALARAFAAAGDTTAQAVLLPGGVPPQMIEQMLASLPKELGKASPAVLTRGIQWAAAGVDLMPAVKVHVVVQSQDKEAADALERLIVQQFKQASELPPVRDLVPHLKQLVPALTPRAEGDRLVLTLEEPTLAAALLPVMQKQRAQSGEAMHTNHLRQIALAMHQFHETNHSLPPRASYDKEGKPLLSWRVHLLPYLWQEQLYQQFHLDEPWDSPHNRTLIVKMPQVYALPPNSRVPGEGKTLVVVPVANETIFPDRAGGTQIQDIARGTSNTILFVEVADTNAVIWTKPEDLNVTRDDPLKSLLQPGQRGIRAVFADGSFRLLPTSIPPNSLWEMFTRGGPRHDSGFAFASGEENPARGRPWLLAALIVLVVAVSLAAATWFLARRLRKT